MSNLAISRHLTSGLGILQIEDVPTHGGAASWIGQQRLMTLPYCSAATKDTSLLDTAVQKRLRM